MDAFGKRLPSFNIKGKDSVNTIAGGVFSIALYIVLFMYSALKFTHLASKHNPNISTFYKVDELTGKYLNLNKHKFMFAITVESFLSPKI